MIEITPEIQARVQRKMQDLWHKQVMEFQRCGQCFYNPPGQAGGTCPRCGEQIDGPR